MSDTRDRERLMALAGVIQAAWLVDQIARTGDADVAAMNASLLSLFSFDPASTEEVYGGLANLRPGLTVLRDVLGSCDRDANRDILRYSLGLIHLERKLAGRTDLQAIIHSRLQHTEKKLEYFSNDIKEISSNLSAIYQDTISTFKYRIQVTGSYQQLQQPANAEQIRALLLAGIRSAVLWRQLGGNRWRLIFGRRALLHATSELLAS